ncbi:MAG: thioredoxin-dependent thiol peroxidase [Bacteroidales bacterium]|nr:thioredoxin-dependent thiol peroxidase [Bacteroidales bacterium]MBN2762266.1 thioredoxin-dependent thiol peroxidase [Bacteroidales bacterium]
MTQVKEGAVAPVFRGKDQDGKTVSLEDFKGKKVILYFYPKDDTPGCTAEACNLRDNYEDLLARGFAIIGVSPDNEKSHTKFKSKHGLPFPLIADPEAEIIKAYGAWGEKKMYGKSYMGVLRTTYVIDEQGKILKVITKVDTGDHAGQILTELGLN